MSAFELASSILPVLKMSSNLETDPALARTEGESASPFTASFAITDRFYRRGRLLVHEPSAFQA
jgi:hypothetical protein